MTLVALNILSVLALVLTRGEVLKWLGTDPRVYPWTVVTYTFVNLADPIGYAIMIVWLWWIGTYLERFWGSRKFLVAWLAVAIVHDLVFLLCSGHGYLGLFLVDSTLTVAWTILNSGASILFMFVLPMNAVVFRYITLLGIFVAAGIQGGPIAGVAAVVVALVFGYWTVVAPGRGLLPARYQRGPAKKKPKSKAKLNLVSSEPVQPVVPLPATPTIPTALEKDIDRILDKIRLEGMAALTPEEKNLLDEHSSRLRRGG